MMNLTTAQKMKFSIQDFFSKCDQIRGKLRIWSHLLKKSLMEDFIFCARNTNNFLNMKYYEILYILYITVCGIF